MFRILYLIAVLSMTGSTIVANLQGATNNANKEIVLTENQNATRPIRKEMDVEPGNGLTPRSVIFQPAYAYLCNNIVSIDFTEMFSTVNIIITHESTGEIVYTETYSAPATLSINLNGESSGEYLIKIEADDVLLEGVFSL